MHDIQRGRYGNDKPPLGPLTGVIDKTGSVRHRRCRKVTESRPQARFTENLVTLGLLVLRYTRARRQTDRPTQPRLTCKNRLLG